MDRLMWTTRAVLAPGSHATVTPAQDPILDWSDQIADGGNQVRIADRGCFEPRGSREWNRV